tara:strand:+ start:78 stop:923 length:846 start_codon:yes stop_codon:yes gene_type:complete
MRGIAFSLVLFFAGHVNADCSPAKNPSRIAVAGGSITELIYLLKRDSQIIAVDTTSNYPDETSALPSIGYVRNLSAEGILSLKPTLILGEHDMGPPEVLEQLKKVSLEVKRVKERQSAEGIVEKFACLAKILHVPSSETNRIKTVLQGQVADLEKIKKRTNQGPRVALILSFIDGSPILAGNKTSGNGVLEMIGAINVFSDIEGWKPATRESVLIRNPDHLVITERGLKAQGGIEILRKNPALRSITAVRNGHIHALDGMALLGFGPRTLETAILLSEKLR